MKSSNIAIKAKLMSVKERPPANGMLLTETKLDDRQKMDLVAVIESRPVGLIAVSVVEVKLKSPRHRKV